ncbi:MAG TPA: glycosyltransferase family 4 protein [Bacteroidota bacterium]|nr:glycosyltransferase family 4 protein [Bacteroidota bacterium]
MEPRAREKPCLLFAGMWFGGTATVLQNLRAVISSRNDVDSTWMPIEYQPPEWFARVPPFSSNLTLQGGLIAASRLRKLRRSGRRFDAMYFNDHIPALFLNRECRKVPSVMAMDVTPKLMEAHRAWYGVSPPGRLNLMERMKFKLIQRAYQQATFLLPWSHWVKNSLVEHYRIEERKIRVLAPGIDLELWKPPEKKVPSDSCHCILFVGNHFLRKGGDLLCSLAQRPAFRSCEFHLVTNNAPEQTPPNVIVHRQVSPNSPVLLDLYRMADIFVLPTRADFFPLAIMEAMAMRLPVIATNIASIDEMVIEGETGYLIPNENEVALADRLQRLMANTALRIAFGEKARRKAEQQFNLRRNAEVILELMLNARQKSLPGTEP